MPRNLPEDLASIAAALKRRHPRFADVPWVEIHDVTQAEAARTMGESAVFLSLSHKESFGLPPLEAISCGCLATGYHGDGGREYMSAENGGRSRAIGKLASMVSRQRSSSSTEAEPSFMRAAE